MKSLWQETSYLSRASGSTLKSRLAELQNANSLTIQIGPHMIVVGIPKGRFDLGVLDVYFSALCQVTFSSRSVYRRS